MKTKIFKNTIKAASLLAVLAVVSCAKDATKKQEEISKPKQEAKEVAVVTPEATTYQHIALATIKDDMWDAYIDAMHTNIKNSRQEEGNIIFTLFQPEDGAHEVAFMERFKDTVVFGKHLKAPYLPEAITQQSLVGEMEIRTLKEVAAIPAVEPVDADTVVTPRNIIVFFDVKPTERAAFIKAMATVTKHARNAKGNVRFNVFQETADANKFVLLESWKSSAEHETHLAQAYSKAFDDAVANMFVSNPMETRIVAKDISM